MGSEVIRAQRAQNRTPTPLVSPGPTVTLVDFRPFSGWMNVIVCVPGLT